MTDAHAPRARIGLVQINNSFSGQNYLPYSVACLQSYADAHLEHADRFEYKPFIYKRLPIKDIVAHLSDVQIAGFSTYVWNAEISLESARRLKDQNPDVLIVFGGPQVPDHPELFLRDNPQIDVVVHNEGERTFAEILDMYPARDWADIQGISFLDADGKFVRTEARLRIRELHEVPSPFLNGLLDNLIASNPEESWIGLWETNRGCPFKCAYCDWGSATAAKVTKFSMDRLLDEVRWFANHKIEYIFCCDANFGILPRDVELAEKVAEIKKETGYPVALSVQNTKNATERAYQTQFILAEAGLNKGVALSMQSLDMGTLENVMRENVSLETYFELQRRFSKDNIETYSDLILAMPGETYESFISGVDMLIDSGQHNRIQFNNLSILPNAQMADPEYIKKYGLKTVRSEIINIHGAREASEDDVPEYQELVVATHSMPQADWRKNRAVAWMMAFLHFDKILQMPLIVVRELAGVPYRNIFEAFMDVDGEAYPLLGEIRDFFIEEARSIQGGGTEYIYSKEWLGIYWPADEYMYIRLTAEKRFPDFYAEAERLLMSLASKESTDFSEGVLHSAIKLNEASISQPFVKDDISIQINHDVLGFCESVREGRMQPLKSHSTTIEIKRSASYYDDFNAWCQEVVWWGNKKGAYLYNNRLVSVEPQLSGHF